jgi:hypothetical protein
MAAGSNSTGSSSRADQTTSGWKIRLTVPGEPVRLYAVAEGEPHVALILAQKATGAAVPRDRLETVERIPARVLKQLGVKAGEIKDLTV